MSAAPSAPSRWLRALWPDTLFARLACLLAVVVIASHALALALLFELRPPLPERPPYPGAPPGMPQGGAPGLQPITITAGSPWVVRRVLPPLLSRAP